LQKIKKMKSSYGLIKFGTRKKTPLYIDVMTLVVMIGIISGFLYLLFAYTLALIVIAAVALCGWLTWIALKTVFRCFCSR